MPFSYFKLTENVAYIFEVHMEDTKGCFDELATNIFYNCTTYADKSIINANTSTGKSYQLR